MNIVCLDAETLYPSTDNAKWVRFADIENIDSVEIYARTEYNDDVIIERAKNAQIILTNKTPLSENVICNLPELKYIGVLATGYNIVDIEAARKSGIAVTNIPAYSTASVAQTAISLLLAITNRVEHYANENRQGRWCKSEDFSYRDFDWTELSDKYFGVIGFGNTGQATARIANALGMKILVYTSKAQSELPDGFEKVDMDTIFSKSDVVSCHCPLTDSTKNLVNAAHLSMMKRSAILINTSRGPVVNESDLAEALNNGTIAAAGVDVLSKEPAAEDNPLLSAKNCFITPHIAWASTEARERLFNITIDNIVAFVNNRRKNRID